MHIYSNCFNIYSSVIDEFSAACIPIELNFPSTRIFQNLFPRDNNIKSINLSNFTGNLKLVSNMIKLIFDR